MFRYGLTIFLSAFLLFQVQPLIAKYILPWFGGGSSVWTTCLLFFQVILLLGYAYAHFLSSRLTPRRQALVHLGLLAVSLAFLPIAPNAEMWKPTAPGNHVWRILLLLTSTIGMPYFLLSSTGPFLQEIFRRQSGQPAYRLYALSNLGSLLALLSYPFVFEPQLRLWTQIVAWSSGYALFVILCGVVTWQLRNAGENVAETQPRAARGAKRSATPVRRDYLLWLALATCGSVMLMASTNQITLNIPSIPFLWVAPLALYLMTFIICFDHDRWYNRGIFWPLLGLAAACSCVALWRGHHMRLDMTLAIYLGTLFVSCMVCHGELARSRPAPLFATQFYLTVAAGGALGGILVAVIAPLVLPDFWEYQIGLVATILLAVVSLFLAATRERLPQTSWLGGAMVLVAAPLLMLAILKISWETNETLKPLAISRDFYGVLRVFEKTIQYDANGPQRLLVHGSIDHGFQYVDPEKGRFATSYYGRTSGVGLAIDRHPRRFALNPDERHLKIGVLGLGAGTLAAAAQPGDTLTFYEINPAVVDVANKYFTYCKNSGAAIDYVMGDARIEMERQLAAGKAQEFDVLAIDAFSSDSIPMHLLTVESVALYRKHLKPDGILCIHISNLFLDLDRVVRGIANALEVPCVFIESQPDATPGAYFSNWGLLTTNEKFLQDATVAAAIAATRPWGQRPVAWTDDYASLWEIVRTVH